MLGWCWAKNGVFFWCPYPGPNELAVFGPWWCRSHVGPTMLGLYWFMLGSLEAIRSLCWADWCWAKIGVFFWCLYPGLKDHAVFGSCRSHVGPMLGLYLNTFNFERDPSRWKGSARARQKWLQIEARARARTPFSLRTLFKGNLVIGPCWAHWGPCGA